MRNRLPDFNSCFKLIIRSIEIIMKNISDWVVNAWGRILLLDPLTGLRKCRLITCEEDQKQQD
jgi:hypothetical protein